MHSTRWRLAALRRSKAEVVIDELTSLPSAKRLMPEYAAGDRKLRVEGRGNLFRVSQASGAPLSAAVERILHEGSGRDARGRIVCRLT